MVATSANMPQLNTQVNPAFFDLINQIKSQHAQIESWLRQQWSKTPPPFYGSIDLRNAGFKLAPVDTNLFPAGFNNLNSAFRPLCIQAVQATIAEICTDVTRLLIIPESHTRNQFYFENIATLQEILEDAGFAIRIGTMNDHITKAQTITLPSKRQITLEPLQRVKDRVGVENFFPCCIVLNNDLSGGIPEILKGIKQQRIMPSAELGWASRLKSNHFRFYAEVVEEIATHFNWDPWLMMPYFDQCPAVDFSQQEGRKCLVDRTTALLNRVEKKYKEYQINETPFAVIKADQGTYGMAVMMIQDPQELTQLNRKQRNRMSMIKGGKPMTQAIVQEGVHSFEVLGRDRVVTEPVVYLFGRHVVGGFYRVHKNRGPNENLNAPGMNFEPMPFKSPCLTLGRDEHDLWFYLYGLIARLAMLAAARELSAFQQSN